MDDLHLAARLLEVPPEILREALDLVAQTPGPPECLDAIRDHLGIPVPAGKGWSDPAKFPPLGEVMRRTRLLMDDDYFENLLENLSELRVSRRLFYQRITDLFALSVDYQVEAETAKRFYARALEKLAWAIKGKPQGRDTDLLDALVMVYLDLAENRAKQRAYTTMEDWAGFLEGFLDIASEPRALNPTLVDALAAKIREAH